MKKILALICALLTVLVAVPVQAADEDVLQISLESGTCQPGEEAVLRVLLTNNPGVASVTLSIGYDAARLQFESAEFLGAFRSVESISLSEAVVREGKTYLVLSWACTRGAVAETAFAKLRFRSLRADDTGSTPLTLSADPENLFDAQLQNIPFRLADGRVDFPTGPVTVKTAERSDGLHFEVSGPGLEGSRSVRIVVVFVDEATGQQRSLLVSPAAAAEDLPQLDLVASGQNASSAWRLFVLDAASWAPLCEPSANF